MKLTEVEPSHGYLIELLSICADHHGGPGPELFNPETVSVKGQHSSTIHPLTYGCTLWASVPSGILHIATMAGHLVIEVREVKRVSGAGVHPKTM